MRVGNLFVLKTLVSNFWVQAPNIGHHGLKSKSMHFDKKWAKPDENSVAEPELFFPAPAPTFQKAPAPAPTPAPVLHAIRYFLTKENGISTQTVRNGWP